MSSPRLFILPLCDSHKNFTKLMKTVTLTMKTEIIVALLLAILEIVFDDDKD